MQNTLLEAALSFHSLCQAGLHIEFINGENIDLNFKKDQFYHLAGLHKLRDHWIGSTRNKANILFFEVGQYNMVLVLACAQEDKCKRYYPESFFVRTDRKYIDGQTKTRIIAVTKIPNKQFETRMLKI